jgi:hypothetical protein
MPKHTFYVSEEEEQYIERLNKLEQAFRISVSRLIMVSVTACLPTLEKEVPKKRTFMLNNTKVIV